LIELFKICKGFSRIRPEELFHFGDRGKGTSLKGKKLGARRTVEDTFQDGTSWTRGRSMRPASMHLKVN